MLRAQKGKRGDSGNVTLGHLRPQKEVVLQDGHLLRPVESVGSSGGSWASEGTSIVLHSWLHHELPAGDSATLSLSFLICKMDMIIVPSWWDNQDS